MKVQDHVNKATLILDNTLELYEREQAIFKVYMLTDNYRDYMRQLKDLAIHVVRKTNELETSDPHMYGELFDVVVLSVVVYMFQEYENEFIKWNKVENGKVIAL